MRRIKISNSQNRDTDIFYGGISHKSKIKFVLPDGTAEGGTDIVVDEFRDSLIRRKEEGSGLGAAVDVVGVERAVEGVGAAFQLHIDGGASGQTLFGVGAGGDNVDGLNRFDGGHVTGEELNPGVGGADAFDAKISAIPAGAVGCDLHGLGGIVGAAAAGGGRSDARDEGEHALVGTSGLGDVLQGGGRDLGVDVGLVGL